MKLKQKYEIRKMSEIHMDNSNDVIQESKKFDNKIKKLKKNLIDCLYRLKAIVLNNLMIIFIILSAGLGLGIGFTLRRYASLTIKQKVYVAFPGELFLRALNFISMPLIVCNLITGISGLVNKVKRIALRATIFYCVSKFLAIGVAFLIALTVRPGHLVSISSSDLEQFQSSYKQTNLNGPISISDTFLDMFRNLVPSLFDFMRQL